MAWVDPRIADKMARDKGIKEAVRAERDRIAAVAEGFFAPHDNPGGHKITTSNGTKTDAFVNLDGPAPLAVDLGDCQESQGWTRVR